MSKFCTNCGKKIEEGKEHVCEVENEVIESTSEKVRVSSKGFMDEFKTVLKTTLDIFRKPTKVAEDKKVPGYSWIITMIIQTVVLFISFLIGINAIMKLANLGFGLVSISLSDIPFEIYLKIFVICALASLIFLFVFVSIIYLVVNKLFKVECDYKEVLNKFSYPSLIISVTVILFVIGISLHAYLGYAIMGFGTLYFVLVTFTFIKEYFKLDQNKNLWFTPVLILVTSLVGSFVVQKVAEIFIKDMIGM